MVREANMKQAASEKQLKEAWGKVSPRPHLPRAVQSSRSPSYSARQTLTWPGGAPRDDGLTATQDPGGWSGDYTTEIPLFPGDLSGAFQRLGGPLCGQGHFWPHPTPQLQSRTLCLAV